ncbi:hypothetical protein P8S54_03270 [Thiomicrospira sp. R3]|nr:hypothetical protein [Thiomicrospira sp. R3]WFE69329.1 hypothetical protein P8S54_03270 [Thiomicrospira sp. R3]
MGGELNNDWVLWASILAILFTIVSGIVFGWKMFMNMDSKKN